MNNKNIKESDVKAHLVAHGQNMRMTLCGVKGELSYRDLRAILILVKVLKFNSILEKAI